MRTLDLATAPKDLKELIQRIQLAGEAVTIQDGGQIVARIVPLKSQPREPGSAKGQITISDDFDAPMDDFEGYR